MFHLTYDEHLLNYLKRMLYSVSPKEIKIPQS